MTEGIAYNEYGKLKDNTIITMKICPSVDLIDPRACGPARMIFPLVSG